VDRDDLVRAPRELLTGRLRLLGPQPSFAPMLVESVNRSLPTLGFINWGQAEWLAAQGERFMARDLEDLARGECLVFYAFELAGGAYVGRVDLHSWDFDAPRCEIGYVADARQAGRGLMREAVLACVSLAFGLGVARVQAISEIGNARALRFAEQALGFTREGVLRYFERDAQKRLGEQVIFAAYNPAAA
jgi:RimJ/RimL family protein N-acetyltransferase